MFKQFISRKKVAIWQLGFLFSGATWLLAPLLNKILSPHTSFISQYETSSQPYSWLFRLGDIIAALLFLSAVFYIQKKHKAVTGKIYVLLMVIGFLMLIDPTITTSCMPAGSKCVEFSSLGFYIHATESVLLGLLLCVLSAYDSLKRKKLSSTFFLIFQISYGLLFISRLANTYNFETLSQYIYQFLTLVWLASLISSLAPRSSHASDTKNNYARKFFASWSFINGTFAIVVSLVHIHLFGFVERLYFANDTAWLAQHGVLVGVTMLYISRHLARGEYRARQLFLILLFIEVIKYSVVSPNFWFLAFYTVTFVALFVMRPYFNRGTTLVSWQARLQEASIVLAGVVSAIGFVVILFINNHKHFEIARQSVRRLSGNVVSNEEVQEHLIRSDLLLHTFTALAVATLFFILWSLFRPIKQKTHTITANERRQFHQLLKDYASSSEDYFKFWPADKKYYWSDDRRSCIAYKITSSVVFALADPLGLSERVKKHLLTKFISHWSGQGYRICFLLVPESSMNLYKDANLNLLQVGSDAVIDIEDFVSSTIKNKWWRWQMNRGRKAGYMYHSSHPPHNQEFLRHLKQVSDKWLDRPGHRERGFALGSYEKTYMQDCQIHYLRDSSSQIIAFCNTVPTFNNLQQTTVDLMRFLPEANNAMPFLLANIISGLHENKDFKFFDLGFVPLANMRGRIAAITKALGSQRFSAKGLEQFKNKFDPKWHNYFIAYDGDITDLAIMALNIEEVMKPSKDNSLPN